MFKIYKKPSKISYNRKNGNKYTHKNIKKISHSKSIMK